MSDPQHKRIRSAGCKGIEKAMRLFQQLILGYRQINRNNQRHKYIGQTARKAACHGKQMRYSVFQKIHQSVLQLCGIGVHLLENILWNLLFFYHTGNRFLCILDITRQ